MTPKSLLGNQVPMLMYIGITKKGNFDRGECHVKGRYFQGGPVFAVNLVTERFKRKTANSKAASTASTASAGDPLPPGAGSLWKNGFIIELRIGAADAIAIDDC